MLTRTKLFLGVSFLLSGAVGAETIASNDKAEYIGATACLACHSDHDGFKNSEHAHNMARVKGVEFEKTCETCHGPGSLHQQAAGDKTNPAFASIRTFENPKDLDVSHTCLQCHQDQNRLHWQGGAHDRQGLTCLSCHSVHHPASDAHQLVKGSEAETCYQCHTDIKAQMRSSAHMPVREGKMSCSSCHNPHGSTTDKQLKADSASQLCYQCHAEKKGPFIHEHQPVRENCLNCHTPHGSHYDNMLVAKLPFLCQRCHDGTRHPSTAYAQTDINSYGNRIFNQSCLNCHANIHGSNHPSGKFFQR